MTSNAPRAAAPSNNLTQDDAAAFLGLKNPRTLAAWRLRQQGPAYVRLGAHVRYRRCDLEAYVAARLVVPPGTATARKSDQFNQNSGESPA